MILSSKDMIKEGPETIYQPTVSKTTNSFFFFVKNLFGHLESVFTIECIYMLMQQIKNSLASWADTFQEVTAKNCQKLDNKNSPKIV